MADKIYDVIIVGGGPGGSTAAAFLGKTGKSVLLLEKEKWPRDKTCGDALSGKTIGILQELGLTDAVEKADHGVIEGIVFSATNGKTVTIRINKPGNIGKGYVCRRWIYDNLLFQNAKKHCEAHEGMAVTGLIRENEKAIGVKARDQHGKEHAFHGKVIVGADGAGSIIANEVRSRELDPKHTCIAYRTYYSGIAGMENNIEIHFVKSIMPGYFWIFPLENGLANVGVGMVMEDMKKSDINLQKAMLDIIEKNPLFEPRFKNAKATVPIKAWQLPFGSKKRKISAKNILLVGDAAGLIDPFSGEGIGNAMLSGKLAARVISEALNENGVDEAKLSTYDALLWGMVWNELTLSYRMQKLGKIDWLLNFVISKAAKSEKAREAIAGTFANQEAKNEYSSPLFYLKLLFS